MKPLLYLASGAALAVVAIALFATLLAPAASEGSYPARYLEALEAHAGVPVEDAHFDPFVQFVTHMSTPDWRDYFDRVYADTLHFSDTLTVLNSNTVLGEYYGRLHAAGAQTSVRVISRQISGNDGYLLWEMQSDFKPLGTPRRSHTIGVTHLRFDAAGRVILHQDFWDAAQGFYQHLPLMGTAIRSVRDSLQPEA
ncbi:MAG: hypothetical protein AAGG11_23290 [Pseudomonadota bacterium]